MAKSLINCKERCFLCIYSYKLLRIFFRKIWQQFKSSAERRRSACLLAPNVRTHNSSAARASLLRPRANPVPVVCSGVHGTAPAYLSDSLRPTSEIVARRCLRSADTTTLQVPSTRRASLATAPFRWLQHGRRTVCHHRLGPAPHFLTFRMETKSYFFRQSYGWLNWRCPLWRSTVVCVELCNSFRCRFCKVPPQLCDGSTIILTFIVVVIRSLAGGLS